MNLIKTNEIVVNKSRFISYRYDFFNLIELNTILEDLKKEHKKARHYCFAYVFKLEGVEYKKYNDDGEPKGTAGLPILNILEKKKIENTLIVVVRYFGGKKLGAGGLNRAYSSAAKSLF